MTTPESQPVVYQVNDTQLTRPVSRGPVTVQVSCTTVGCPEMGRDKVFVQRLQNVGYGLLAGTPVICGSCGTSYIPTLVQNDARPNAGA